MLFRNTLRIAPLLLSAGFAFAANVDLTGQFSSGVVGTAFIEQFTLSSAAGSGVINEFLKISTNNNIESGYNTTGQLEFDTANANAIQLQQIPLVAVNNGNYYEFFLDINQAQPHLSLDSLQLFTATTSNETGYAVSPALAIGAASNVYDQGADVALLSDQWGAGSGKGDYLVYIPQSAFASALPTDFVYLYSKLGATSGYENNGGFEEWYISKSATSSIGGGPIVDTSTPEPSTWFMGLSGILILAGARRRAGA